MPYKVIEKDGMRYTFHERQTLGVSLALNAFALVKDARIAAGTQFMQVFDILRLLMAYTVSIEGESVAARYWAQARGLAAPAAWEMALNTFDSVDELLAWWGAYTATRDDSGAEAEKKQTASPSASTVPLTKTPKKSSARATRRNTTSH